MVARESTACRARSLHRLGALGGARPAVVPPRDAVLAGNVTAMRDPGRAFKLWLVIASAVLSVSASACGSTEREAAPVQTPQSSQAPQATQEQQGCMPDPSVCGFPDVETTGVAPGTSLTPLNGVVTLSESGQVFENRQVTGSIVVTAPDVTIRNVKLIATDKFVGVRVSDGNVVLDHVEIDLNGNFGTRGIAYGDYTVRNSFIHNGSDCAFFDRNVVIEDTLCVSGPDTDGDAWPDNTSFCNGGEHIDGFQFSGGGNITLRHNTVRNPCRQTSAILISNDPGVTDPIRDVTVADNLLGGGGYTLYCADPDDTVASETVTGNRFSRIFFPKGGYWGRTAYCDDVTTFAGNVWDDDVIVPPGSPGTGGGGQGGSGSPANPPPAGAAAPRLALARARRVTRAALKRKLGRRYTRRTGKLRMACDRRTRPVVVCSVKWKRLRGGNRHRYNGSVRVQRVAAASWLYAVHIRSWSSGCGCSNVIRRAGTLAT